MKTEVNTRVLFNVKCVLEEDELRALDALVGYGFNAFLKCFYEHMGKAYLEPYEKDLKALFEKVQSLRPEIDKIKEMRKLLKKSNA